MRVRLSYTVVLTVAFLPGCDLIIPSSSFSKSLRGLQTLDAIGTSGGIFFLTLSFDIGISQSNVQKRGCVRQQAMRLSNAMPGRQGSAKTGSCMEEFCVCAIQRSLHTWEPSE